MRRARKGETLALLNGQNAELDEEVLVIADDARVLALAGIMGGQGSGVETTTRDVFLESAFFEPDAIAGRARRFGLATDSSFRFERGVDFAATRQALERATAIAAGNLRWQRRCDQRGARPAAVAYPDRIAPFARCQGARYRVG